MKNNVMITSMKVLPEKQKEMLQTLLSLTKSQVEKKGCLKFAIYRDIENEYIFNLISEWETRQNLDHYMKSDSFGVLLGTKSLLCEPLKVQIFTVTNSQEIETVDSMRKLSN